MRQMIMNTYSAIAPDTATLNRALGEAAIPVLIENPFTPGLYSLITSVDNYVTPHKGYKFKLTFCKGKGKGGRGTCFSYD